MTSMTENPRPVRKDGKPARKQRLGIPAGSPRPNSGHATPPAPEWHALVVAGPKGDPRKALARAEQVRQGVTLPPSSVSHGRQQHGVPVRRWPMGGLVLHGTHAHVVDGGPRPDVQRRRLVRAGVNPATDSGHLALLTLLRHEPRAGGIDRTHRTAAAVANKQRRDALKAAA